MKLKKPLKQLLLDRSKLCVTERERERVKERERERGSYFARFIFSAFSPVTVASHE